MSTSILPVEKPQADASRQAAASQKLAEAISECLASGLHSFGRAIAIRTMVAGKLETVTCLVFAGSESTVETMQHRLLSTSEEERRGLPLEQGLAMTQDHFQKLNAGE